MATLQKIRNRGPVIAIVIGIALLAFLLGDFLSSGQAFFSEDQNVAEIDGTGVSIQEYQSFYTKYEEGFKLLTGTTVNDENQDYIKAQVWDKIIKIYALSDTYEDLGIDVSSAELARIISGENIQTGLDPLTRQVFSDPTTGQFNSQAAVNFFSSASQSLEGSQVAAFLEAEMLENRKFTKYTALISKGINITDFEAKMLYKERVELVDFDYTVKKFNSISDSSITVTDKELMDFYEIHKDEYEQEESRDIAYITIDVISSDMDKEIARKDIDYYKTEFAEIKFDTTQEDIINWVNANSQTPFSYPHITLEELGDTALFNLSPDSTIGPVLEDGFYVMKRNLGKVNIPDSVEARHILIRPDGQNILDLSRANEIADSLKLLIEGGSDFAELARTNSADGSAQTGGDLGTFVEGQYPMELSDACFFGKVGDLLIVESQYGVHIVEIMDQTSEKKEKVRLALVTNEVRPGNNTISEYFSKARDFSVNSENNIDKFDELVAKGGYIKRVATDISPETQVIAGIDNSRQIINWIYTNEVELNTVSSPFQDENLFIVAIVTAVREKGIAPFEQIKEDITLRVIKEKKGELLAKEMKGTSNLEKNAKNISFSSSRLNDEGIEYAVISTASLLAKDLVSEPIIGETGVYVVKVTSKTGVSNLNEIDVSNDKSNAQMRIDFRVSSQAFEALKKSSEVEDNRYKYF